TPGQTFTVMLGTDLPDGDLSDGTCSTVDHNSPPDPSTCTLRAAMQEADHTEALDTIAFNLPGPTTISVGSYLPDMHYPVVIDGWTQPGMTSGLTSVPPPLIRVDGSAAPRISCQDELIQTGPFSQNEGRGFLLF